MLQGVVLSHGNLVQALLCLLPTACAAMDITAAAAEDDCYIALLPLAHVLELLAEHVMLVELSTILRVEEKALTSAFTTGV